MTLEFYNGDGRMPDNTLLIPANTRPPESMTEYLGWFADGVTKELLKDIIAYTQAFLADREPESVDGWIFKGGGRYHVSFTPGGWRDLITAITSHEREALPE